MTTPSAVAFSPSSWVRQSQTEPLSAGEIHIWSIPLIAQSDHLATLSGWLSDKEQQKANRLLSQVKRNYQIQSKAWLRWLLASYLKKKPPEIFYQFGQLGKPSIANEDLAISFNATDSGNCLLCAFALDNELGLDVEATPRQVKYQRIAQKKYTDKEQMAINALPPAQQSNAFLAIWTRKEAYGKALGLGIRYPMREHHLCDDLGEYSFEVASDSAHPWQLTQFNYEQYIACLVSQKKPGKLNFYKLDVDRLELA